MDRREFLRSAGALGIYAASPQGDVFDLVLRGGSVIDGSGRPPRRADIAIRGERIARIGNLSAAVASRTLDVSGLSVSPGFIDVHTHSDDELRTNPKAESKIRQGVTTELFGMDGSSYDPLHFGDALRRHEELGSAVNVGSFVGQGTVRGTVVTSNRAADEVEIGKMRHLAAAALRDGAMGISSGLEYTPGGFAPAEEIAELCKVMRGTSGLYATHMRNEDDRVLEAVREAIGIAEAAGVGLHISHLKCQGRRNWGKVDEVFAAILDAESRGVSVTMDRYPYVAYSTSLSNLMPLWSREGGTEKLIERLSDPELWPRIRQAMEEKIALLGSWDSVMVEGETIEDVVSRSGEDPFLYTRSLIIERRGRVGMVGFGMGEETTARILAHRNCMPASDGSSLATYGELSRGNPHPRSYGTFARVLGKYVREMNIMPLEEAVRKMTSLPAERFGILERGRLAEGYFADIAVFDPAKVNDRATFADPHEYAEGFEAVIVNGKLVLEGDQRTEELPGMVIRGSILPVVQQEREL